ncbi:transporter substrate-binding domain-containing protein [Stutzerimonas marianensis]
MGGMMGVLLLTLLASTSAVAEVLRLAGNAWPPYTDQRLPNSGLSVDLISTALGRAGYQVQYVEVPWERALRGLKSGDYDMVNGWWSAKRARFASSSRPFLSNRMRWVQRSEDKVHYDGVDSLTGYAIALSRGYAYGDELPPAERLHIGYAINFVQAARMVLAGRVDLTLEDERTAQFHFDRELADASDLLSFVPGEFRVLDLSLVVRNDHPRRASILEAFDREIAAMLEDGSYAEIFARHGLPVPSALPQP